MRHWTPDEVRAKLINAVARAGSYVEAGRMMNCDDKNLNEACKGKRAIPRDAARYLGLRRVTAYIKEGS